MSATEICAQPSITTFIEDGIQNVCEAGLLYLA